MPLPPAARPDDRDALRAAVREVRATSGMSVAFAGPVGSGSFRIAELLGGRTRYLRGLEVRAGAGLGGRVLSEGRAAGVEDYGRALDITHDYDGPVLAEGLRTVAAVPVLVDGRPRAVLYAASREGGSVGDRVRDALARAASRMAAELGVRDEVDRRLALMAAVPSGPPAAEDPARWEEVRAVHADLRLAASATDDAALRDRLLSACTRLAALGAAQDEPATVHLSGREVDVLTQVALGCSNRETAARLSLRPETVKSYLGSAMTKLDAHTRLEAVVRARRLGLLP
ncbi:DNA-binding CsgD family transcriptional regulator [Geodermatophilus bullaregiensis]|uniref:LuxR C-terminal-related transcriptional regulator n=1 Tax=Geodermatophilus bullaregiensis TaxID=1564160 RepID=UPI0027DB85B0|nr:LuxR C-terminal-related transcriptional regulator [Geodermatophilus bullaregiensis]MBM7806448.1 DNA-binding CsgD family transcriptional regulator [Geodermatophilus bullaregiensis]